MKPIQKILVPLLAGYSMLHQVESSPLYRARPTFADMIEKEIGQDKIDVWSANSFKALREISTGGSGKVAGEMVDELVKRTTDWFNKLPDRGLSDFELNYKDFIEDPCNYLQRDTAKSSIQQKDERITKACEQLLDKKVRTKIRRNIFEHNCADLCVNNQSKLKCVLDCFTCGQ